MRTQTAEEQLASQRAWCELTPLLKIEFSAPSPLTLRFSDRYIVAGGEQWLPMVESWGTIDEALSLVDASGVPGTVTIGLFNTEPVEGTGKARLSDLIRTPLNTDGTYEWAYAKVSLYLLWDPSHALGEPWQVFFLEPPDATDDEVLTVRMSDLSLLLENQLRVSAVKREDFPTCSPVVVGQPIRRPFGSLKGVPAIPVVDGTVTTLDGAITDTATTVTLNDETDVPNAGTGKLESELVTWTGRAGKQLLNVTRGAHSTTASAHDDNARLFVLRDKYVYVVGEVEPDFPAHALATVKTKGQLARTSPTVSVLNTTLCPGKALATIEFAVADVKTFHLLASGDPWAVAVAALTVTVDGASHIAGTRTIPVPAGAEIGPRTTRTVNFTINSPSGHGLTSAILKRKIAGGTYVTIATVGAQAAGWSHTGSDTKTYDSIADEVFELRAHIAAAPGATVRVTFDEYTIAAEAGEGSSTASLILGDVTCDIDGIEDDASGTITGTPGLMLENPGHIAKFIHLYLLPNIGAGDLLSVWTTTIAKLASAGYRWAVMLEAMPYSVLRHKLGEQARSLLYITAGKLGFTFLLGKPSADVTLDYLKDLDAEPTPMVKSTPLPEVRNQVTVYSQRDYSAVGDLASIYRRVTTHEDLDQPGLGEPRPFSLELPFVQDANTARDLGEFWLGMWKRPRPGVGASGSWNLSAIERTDCIAVDNDPVLDGRGGSELVLRVLEQGLDPDTGQISFSAFDATIEANAGPEDDSMAYGSRGLRGKNNAVTPTTQYDISADALVLRNASNLTVVRHNPGSLTLNISAAGPVANGRDQAAAFAADSWIHVYHIWDPTSLILALTASTTAPPTGPALPSGFTHWGYACALRVDGSGNIVRTTVCGCMAQRQNVELVAASVSVSTEQSVDGSAAWPPNALGIGGTWSVQFGAVSETAALRPQSGVDSGLTLEGTAADHFGGPFFLNVDGQTLYYIQSVAAARVWRLEVSQYKMPNGGE